ncbi:hexokinase-4-like [Diadema setosum]|uniref:hexokinase-4-like n=1 Tax=Diadema setosum TaxID=31175 RepID=UPI003B3B7D7F
MRRLEGEMNKGLKRSTNEEAKIKMLPTYVTSLPDGTEKGNFLALDLGGSNFRVLLVTINNGKSETCMDVYTIPNEVMTGPGDQLFDYIAEHLGKFTRSHNLSDMQIPLGFTFSFPCFHNGLASATLVTWTKGYDAAGVEGKDVVPMLQEACKRKNVRVDIVALMNDTVATQMAGAFRDHSCLVGLIMGTGMNASYLECTEKVEMFEGERGPDNFVIIDCEWGAFGDNGCLEDVRTAFDRDIDRRTFNHGKQFYEKMIAGMYLGEILRLAMIHLADQKALFGGDVSDALRKEWAFKTKNLTFIENDTSENLDVVREILEKFDLSPTQEDLRIVHALSRAVWRRGAKLAAAGLSQMARRINKPRFTVSVDGSLYQHFSQYRELMMSDIKELVPQHQVDFLHALDGSGIGGAVTAAVAVRLNRAKKASTSGPTLNGDC